MIYNNQNLKMNLTLNILNNLNKSYVTQYNKLLILYNLKYNLVLYFYLIDSKQNILFKKMKKNILFKKNEKKYFI